MALPQHRSLSTIHLFAGAGGGILADLLIGDTPICACELAEYPRKVLLARQRDRILPWFPIWDDVRTFNGKPWRGKADVICAGFPCQDISPARTNNHVNGEQRGLDGNQSGLWYEVPRIIREVRPTYVRLENLPHLRTRGLLTILKTLDEVGYDTARGVFGSRMFGADHDRERMWIVAKTPHPHETQQQRGGISSRVHQEYTHTCSTDWGESEPRLERVANGMACQMDRLKAIGNGQDARVAALAWETLTAIVDAQT